MWKIKRTTDAKWWQKCNRCKNKLTNRRMFIGGVLSPQGICFYWNKNVYTKVKTVFIINFHYKKKKFDVNLLKYYTTKLCLLYSNSLLECVKIDLYHSIKYIFWFKLLLTSMKNPKNSMFSHQIICLSIIMVSDWPVCCILFDGHVSF